MLFNCVKCNYEIVSDTPLKGDTLWNIHLTKLILKKKY